MTMRDRKKASDVFRESNFVFVEKVAFEKAFPEIEDVSVVVEEQGDGVSKWTSTRSYGKSSVGEYIDCSNPLCYNGGFSIGSILREMVRNKDTHKEASEGCRGYEGSPKGRRKYRDCMNYFKIKIDIKYKTGKPTNF